MEGAAAHAGLVEGVQVGAGVDEHAGSLQCGRVDYFSLFLEVQCSSVNRIILGLLNMTLNDDFTFWNFHLG